MAKKWFMRGFAVFAVLLMAIASGCSPADDDDADGGNGVNMEELNVDEDE